MSLLRTIRNHLLTSAQSVRRNEKGNIAIMTAATLIGVTLIMGGAIDLYNYEAQRKRVQAVVDSCVLLGTRLDNGAETEDDVKQIVADCANKQGVPLQTANVRMTTTAQEFSEGIRGVNVDYSAEVETFFLPLAKIDSLSMGATADAFEQEQYAEISIVLDLSASMAFAVSADDQRRRIDLMRGSVATFVSSLLANGASEVTTINIIPYSSQVNIGRGMFEHLGVKRDHDYTSCVDVPFDGSNQMQTVKNTVSGLKHTPAFHLYDYDDWYAYPAPVKKSSAYNGTGGEPLDLRSFNLRTGKKWDTPLDWFFEDKDSSKERELEFWGCPDDPHAYMLKPYEPSGVVEPGSGAYNFLPEVTVGGRKYPLYRGDILDHAVDCPAFIRYRYERKKNGKYEDNPYLSADNRCTWTEDDWDTFLAGDFEPKMQEDTSNGFVAVENANEISERGHLAIDDEDPSIIYMSNDETKIRSHVLNLPIVSSTATDQGVVWGRLLLDPDFQPYIEGAAEAGLIEVEKDFRDRPMAFFSKDKNVGTNLPFDDKARKTKKFLILLTDGEANSSWTSTGGGTNINHDYGTVSAKWTTGTSNTNTRVQNVCEDAINKGVTIYTIAFALDSTAGKNALVRCAAGDSSATEHENAYEAGSNLNGVLNTISAKIARLRLTS